MNPFGLIIEEEAIAMYYASKANPQTPMKTAGARERDYHGRIVGGRTPAKCHPEKSVMAHGLCRNCYWRVLYRCDPEARATKAKIRRRHNLKALYELTPAQYDAMLADQGNACAICRNPEPNGGAHRNLRLAVDHDHETGRIRGLLCHPCNLALGRLGPHLDAALRYLEKAVHDRDRTGE